MRSPLLLAATSSNAFLVEEDAGLLLPQRLGEDFLDLDGAEAAEEQVEIQLERLHGVEQAAEQVVALLLDLRRPPRDDHLLHVVLQGRAHITSLQHRRTKSTRENALVAHCWRCRSYA